MLGFHKNFNAQSSSFNFRLFVHMKHFWELDFEKTLTMLQEM